MYLNKNNLDVNVISLISSHERRLVSINQLNQYFNNWLIIDAVDGDKINFPIKEYKKKCVSRLLGFEMSPKEIGCFLSHQQAWKNCIKNNSLMLVLEDDFQIQKNFLEILNYIHNENLNWDIIRLQGLRETENKTLAKFSDSYIVQNLSDPLGATAYIIKPSAAIKLLNASKYIYEPVDHFIERKKNNLKIIAIKPYPIYALKIQSTINDRGDRKPIKGLKKIRRSIFRLIHRAISAEHWF